MKRKITFSIYSIILIFIFSAIADAFINSAAAGAMTENSPMNVIHRGYLSELPRNDAQVVLKKVADSLELRGISNERYDIKYSSQTNSFVLKTCDEATRDIVISTISSVEKYYYETTRSEVIYLKYANARDTAAILNNTYTPMIFLKPAADKRDGNKKRPEDANLRIIKKRDEKIDISFDMRTNSLVVTAAQNVIDLIKNTVDMIDRKTSLVHVKVLIAEVTLDDTSQFGLEWKYAAQNKIDGNSVRQNPSVDFGNLGDPAKQAKLQGLKYSIINGDKFSSFLQMLNSKNKINVLSSPQLLTTNNSKAYFEETIKVPTLQTVTTSTGVVNNSIAYQEIGIKLGVTPQINRDKYINLNINQTIQNIIADATTIQEAPTFSHRLINTNVIAKNGSTVVISGFIKNNSKKSVLRSPLLDQIPYIRNIFSRSSATTEKTELMVFITPVIAKSENRMENIVEDMAKSKLKEKLEPIAKNYNDYMRQTCETSLETAAIKDSQYFEGLKEINYKTEEFLGLNERKTLRTFGVKNITSAPIAASATILSSNESNLKCFVMSGSKLIPLKMEKSAGKGNGVLATIYFPAEIAPGKEAVIKTEETFAGGKGLMSQTVANQTQNPDVFNEISRSVTRENKTDIVMAIHYPYKINIKDFSPEPAVMENKMGGHSLVWTCSGKTLDISGKWRFEDAGEISKMVK